MALKPNYPTRPPARSQPADVPPPDYQKLFVELWTAVQGVKNAMIDLDKDVEFGNSHPEKITILDNSKGYGEEFALFRARRRISFDALKELKTVTDKLDRRKIKHNKLIDRR